MHEHPASATSWSEPSMVRVAALPGVEAAMVDMCMYGMRVKDGDLEGLARKTTRLMSNSNEVVKRMQSRCVNLDPTTTAADRHVHVPLVGGRARQCQVYPRAFCRKLCEGNASEKRLMTMGMTSLPLMSAEDSAASEALHEGEAEYAYDDQSGEALDPALVRKARMEEMAYFKSMRVYDKVSLDECKRVTGGAPISVRWVDINKGDSADPLYRSRLVAKEYKVDERPEWYAATPPGECLKI